jgi:hypothetical protein
MFEKLMNKIGYYSNIQCLERIEDAKYAQAIGQREYYLNLRYSDLTQDIKLADKWKRSNKDISRRRAIVKGEILDTELEASILPVRLK